MKRLRFRIARAFAVVQLRNRHITRRTFTALATMSLLSPLLLAVPAGAVAVNPPLGTAASFAVLGGSGVTNTGPTEVTGDLGVSPGTSISGFPPGSVTGTVHNADPVATQAQADVGTAYGFAAGEPCDTNLTGQDLGGMTLTPGVYCFDSSAQLTGLLTLDALGDLNAAWLFQITSSLTTASNAGVVLVNGASECGNNITWQVGSSATVGSGTVFLGNILANTSITLNSGANSTGSLYAHTGAVTMDTNNVTTCSGAIMPPPSLSISTTPSGSVPAGGTISDSATVSGGLSPSGDVTFTLFAPGDPTCSGTPFATRMGTLVGGTASSGNVTAGAAGTYNWVATYNGDANNAPVTSPCGSEMVVVTSQTLTGRAYGLAATATLNGIPLVNVPPTPDTGAISTTSSSSTSTPCVASLGGLVSAHVLCANVTTVAFPGKSTATASVADATVAITAIPTITLRAVQSTSTTTCGGSTGTTTIAFLKVGSTVVISAPTNVAPNTKITVGVVKLILNEQIPFVDPDAGLTVNAVHATVSALGLAQTNVVIASSESDIGNCP
ncbi:MAG TPA: ice-binding family protein [Acidimicrobiales bacterium]|nr:ice-binding family protein [Acidimicrobiales bacterium]